MATPSINMHKNGLEYIDIQTSLCEARIFLQGAQIYFFKPKDQAPLLWGSQKNDYLPGQGIRGGVPICWPWFGQHANPNYPQHGFARTSLWELESYDERDNVTYVSLRLPITKKNKQFWPHNTAVNIQFELSDTLTIHLINTNLGHEKVRITQALHTYFPIENIHQLEASGFSHANYIEFNEGPYQQLTDVVKFTKETDRVYTQLSTTQYLKTPQGIIQVSRENSQSAVLWNPWIEKSKHLSCFDHNDYLSMVCLEAANVLNDKVELNKGETHKLTTHIGWKV